MFKKVVDKITNRKKEPKRISYEEAMKSPTTCLYAFSHCNFAHSGTTAPCFATPRFNSVFDEEFGWNSEEWRNLRKDLLNGVKSDICKKCWWLEDAGSDSYRMNANLYQDFDSWRDCFDHYDPETGRMERAPRQVELRFSNKCNFECPICCSEYSSRWEKRLDKDNELYEAMRSISLGSIKKEGQCFDATPEYTKALFEAIEKWKSDIDYILLSGGETLIQDDHYRALEILKPYAQNITMEYTTNLSALKYKGVSVVDAWRPYKSIRVKISMDGDPYIYPYVRKYGKVEILEKNIETLFAECENLESFQGSLTSSVFNVPRITEMMRYVTKMGLGFHVSQVFFPEKYRTQVLPLEEKKIITDKTLEFLEDLEGNLAQEIDHNLRIKKRFWHSTDDVNFHLHSLRAHAMSTINYMNAEDNSRFFPDIIKYDSLINPKPSKGLLDYYPHWRDYLDKA